jgi:hypothetical protein
MQALGILLFFLAMLTLFVGFIVLLVGAVGSNKKRIKTGLYIMLGGGISLLISLTLCSTGKIDFR